MACTPLDIGIGPFYNDVIWEKTSVRNFDGKTVSLTSSGIQVQNGAKSFSYPQTADHSLSYAVLGNKYLLILDADSGAAPAHVWLHAMNFDTMTTAGVFDAASGGSTMPKVVVNQAPGSGVVFLAYCQDGTNQVKVGIYRSDTGKVLCSIAAPFSAQGKTFAEATATDLIIHYNPSSPLTLVCPRPMGKCTLIPSSLAFPTVYVGGCPFTPPARQFTIRNGGDDCLVVQSFGNSPPFSAQASRPLPAGLLPGEQMQVTVTFEPPSTGSWIGHGLPVATTPANGATQVSCSGSAAPAEFHIDFSSTNINFGKEPVGQTRTLKLLVSNIGSKPLSVSSSGVAADDFQVQGFAATINCNAPPLSVDVRFSPQSEGPHTATFLVAHSAPGSPTAIQVSGEGCIPNAEMVVLDTGPVDFGQVEQGFRTVRLRTVANPGDGQLRFQARIGGADAGLFGLPDPQGPVDPAPADRAYSADPSSPCGEAVAAGTGEALIAISFRAQGSARLATASLTLAEHNATNEPPGKTWVIPLAAEIVPPVALDVALVIDRSQSMMDKLGPRVKLDAVKSACNLFAELLREDMDDRAAVVRFNNERDVLFPMSPVTATTAPTTRAEIGHVLDQDLGPAAGLTAIAGGAMLAMQELQKPRPSPPANLKRAVVVVTDGKENTAFQDGDGTWRSILGGQMYTPTAQKESDKVGTSAAQWPPGMELYAVGIGTPPEDVNSAQLEGLTRAPERVFYVDRELSGKEYFQLEKYYTQIFMDVVGTQSVKDPVAWIAPGDTHEIEFEVLRGDRDALVVMYDFEGLRLPFFCVSPRGEVIDPSSVPAGFELRSGYTRVTRFVEFKMPWQDPGRYAGTWKIVIRHQGRVCFGAPSSQADEPGFMPLECHPDFNAPLLYGFAVGVGSDFRMLPFVTPAPVSVGQPILLTALVSEAGLPMTGCKVVVEVTAPDGMVSNVILKDDGAHLDGAPNDGEYAWSFTQTFVPGVYHFRFQAFGWSRDGRFVVREALRDKPVSLQAWPGRGEPGSGRGDDERVKDGDPPPQSTCCDELMRQLKATPEPPLR